MNCLNTTLIIILFTIFIFTIDSSDIINDEIKEEKDKNFTFCLSEDKSFGLCVYKSHCNGSDSSVAEDCPTKETVCCKQSNIKRWNSILWSSGSNFWSGWPTLPARPTWSTRTTRPYQQWTRTIPSTTVSVTFNAETCGLRNLNKMSDELKAKDIGYIVGGIEAAAHSWPWAVAVYIGSGSNYANYRFVCGASVISNRYILGAAHCVSHGNRITKPENIRLLIGAHDRRYEGKYYGVDKVLVHSKYDERLMQNDIALYRLSETIDFATNEDVGPVCLPSPEMDGRNLNRKMAFLVGWGTIYSGGRVSDYLRQVQVPIIPNHECAQSYSNQMISSKQLCAGYPNGKMDSCQGDSGGPMTLQMENNDKKKSSKYVQIGIVSWGKGCAEPKYPGVYTKVSSYLEWIHSNLNSNT